MFKVLRTIKCAVGLSELSLQMLARGSKPFPKRRNLRALHATFSRSFCCNASSGPDIAAITNGDSELEHKLKVLILEVEVMRQEGRLVPAEEYMKDRVWKELLNLPSLSARRRYLEFVFKNSKRQENQTNKKLQKKLEWEHKKSEQKEEREDVTFEEFVSRYDLGYNNLFLRFYDSTINQMYNNRLIQAMQFGQKLVVDCGYDQQMTSRENRNCAKQLTYCFAENRNHNDPYDLHFCNLNPNSTLMQSLTGYVPIIHEKWFPLHIHETSYLDLFPKEQLVYLTPHCREEMLEYDHDAIYIIGGIVDKVNNEPLSLAKAKKEGIKMAKFPLERFLQWSAGSGKSLTLNQVTAILLDLKHTGDWKFALRHVPKRKLTEMTPESVERSRLRTWSPSKKTNFDRLSFNPQKPKEKQRTNIRTIMYDDG